MKPWLQVESRSRAVSTRPGAVISSREWWGAWGRIAANSFGGPAGQISVMHEELVDRRHWVSERRFLHALNYCMILPGPEAQQLATYLGWLLRGPMGGLGAGAIFILPGFVAIMALSILFAEFGNVGWVEGLFFGISAAVIAIVANAVVRIGRRVITNRVMLTIATAAFVGIFFLELPFPLIVALAAAIGLIGGRIDPDRFQPSGPDPHRSGEDDRRAATLIDDTDEVRPGDTSAGRFVRVATTGLALWFGPIAILALTLGGGHVLVRIGWFFSTAAVLTFGGAYSVLAYISQESVGFGWLLPDEMITGLGMAETTPGPLIQVVQFVGFMGPYRDSGGLDPLMAGMLGAIVATWVTFVPSFLWIFLGGPHVERLRGRVSLTAALSTVTAAVVGVVLNLALWFALFTLFDSVDTNRRGGLVVYEPHLDSLDLTATAIAVGAMVVVFRQGWPTSRVVLAAAAVGIAHQLIT